MDRAGVARQIDDRLSSRVARASHDHVVAATEPRFHLGGGVVDARAFEVAESRQIEPPV